MKIGYIVDSSLDSTAGVQQFTLAIGEELARQGHSVSYLTSTVGADHPQAERIYGLSKTITTKMNGNRVDTPLPASKSLIREVLAKEKFDVLHVMTPYSPVLAGRVITAANDSTAVVGTFHIAVDTKIAEIGAKLLAKLQKRSLKRVDYWTAVSHAAEDFATECYGIKPEEITPNPITLKNFKVKKDNEFSSSRPTIVFLGRLVERKGAQHLLRAVSLLPPTALKELRVLIGGNGPLRSSMEQFVAQNNLADVVEFRGFVAEEDKAKFLAAADICVFPSTGGECFGISLLEGMAVNHPVVLGGDNKGYRTVLGKGPDLLLNPTDYQAFADKLHALLDDKAARQKAVAWQSKEVQRYDTPLMAKQLLSVYERALERRKS